MDRPYNQSDGSIYGKHMICNAYTHSHTLIYHDEYFGINFAAGETQRVGNDRHARMHTHTTVYLACACVG